MMLRLRCEPKMKLVAHREELWPESITSDRDRMTQLRNEG